jgi:hypothetical protein
MLKTQGVARTAVAVVGLVAFCAVMGFGLYALLEDQWPEMPFALAVVLAIAGPVAFLLAVGIVGATLDKLAGRTLGEESAPTETDA